MTPPLSLRALNRATLARQMLLARERVSVGDAVARLAGLQAQLPRPPFIGLWSRVDSFRREDLQAAIAGQTVVRGTLMRGTLHLVAREHYLAFRGALQPVLSAITAGVIGKGGELDQSAITANARRFLRGRSATFEEIRQHLAPLFPDANERFLGYTVRMNVPLLMVPDDSRWSYPPDAAFTLAEDALGELPTESGSLEALILAYLAAFGPATPADFQAWSGFKSARNAFESLRSRLVVVRDTNGRDLFDLPDAPRPGESMDAPVRFLPDYDNLLLGHADRTRVISNEHRPRVATKNLRILPTFLVDGWVHGTWKVERKGRKATVTLEPFGNLGAKVKRELEREADQLLRFVEEDAATFAVSWRP